MPANKKYLTKSIIKRCAKIMTAILGGYFVSISFHLALASWFDRTAIIITMAFTSFILWVGLMIVVFIAKKVWQIALLYFVLTLLFSLIMYLGNTFN